VMGMNASRNSDSRHFGPVSAHPVVAGARPLWTFLGGGRGDLGAGLKRRTSRLGGRQ
jgi:hypothetical protein